MFPLRDTIPSRRPPIMTWALIGLNVLVFGLEMTLSPDGLEALFYVFGLVPARFIGGEWAGWMALPPEAYWSFFTNMFLHGGAAHLIGNMWTLWIFGDNVEDRMGSLRFLIFYVLCGLSAGIVHVLLNPTSSVPAVGASGAISGVLGAYFVLFPRAHVITFVPILFLPYFFVLPASVYLLLWFIIQFFSGTASLFVSQGVGGIAWWAHIGGFVAGVVLHRLFVMPSLYGKRFADEYDYRGVWDLPF